MTLEEYEEFLEVQIYPSLKDNPKKWMDRLTEYEYIKDLREVIYKKIFNLTEDDIKDLYA